ncbi:macrolide transporter subunit MacA [Burkholderia perseverans]|uniref:macrolide transporter subunit MacA n=1 Tax=Burkholderia perseverans TaxID=2615214 RepID=UPI001FED4DFC|nr:macrolide transporter subunit MacA [Burkholderia perseverans]
MKKNRTLRIGTGGGAVALVVLVALYLHFFSSDKSPLYLTARVGRANLENSVLASGTLQAFRQVDVGAQVSGQLKSLKVKLGDTVKKGQWLARIDPVISGNALREAQANERNLTAQQRSAAAQLRQAELAFQRQQQMMRDDATSRQDYERAQADLAVQRASVASFQAQIETARIQIETARANLGYTRIVAPMDGEVVAIVTQEGQTVIAQQQAPVILRLADLDTMMVKAQISEADVIHVFPGQTAYFTILGEPDARRYGKLRAIEPAPQDFLYSQNSLGGASKANAAVFYNALFEVPNPGHRLRTAMTAQVNVLLGVAAHALTIPVAALGTRYRNGSYQVRVLANDKLGHPRIDMRRVRTGINNNVSVEVLDGLKEGERVIINEAADAAETPVCASVAGN